MLTITWHKTKAKMSAAFAMGFVPIVILAMGEEGSKNDHFGKELNVACHDWCTNFSVKEQRKRTCAILGQSTLQPPDCAQNHLHHSQNMQAFVMARGHNPADFEGLLHDFAPLFCENTQHSSINEDGHIKQLSGRSNQHGHLCPVSAHACFGLVLFWTHTTHPCWMMATFFGLTMSPTGLWLCFGKHILFQVLATMDEAKMCMPDKGTICKCAHSIKCNCNRFKILIRKAGDFWKQRPFHNGWQVDHWTDPSLFGLDCLVCVCTPNCPKTLHDSELATFGQPLIHQNVDRMCKDFGAQMVVDSAFCTSECFPQSKVAPEMQHMQWRNPPKRH